MKRRLAARTNGAIALATGMVAALVMPTTATAAPPGPKPATMLKAMQRDLGLTADQAQRRLRREAAANQTDARLRESLKAAYGGSHYAANLGKLVVGVTDAGLFDAVRGAGAEPELVNFSADQLGAVTDGLRRTAAPKQVTGWYVDSSSDSVVLTTAPGTAGQAQDFVRASGVNANAVRVVESAEAPRTYADVDGGNGYTVNGSARCSVGFSVEGGFVSAGHCGKKGDTTTTPNGTFAASTFPGGDYSYVRVAEGETPRPLVNNYQGGTVPVTGSTESAEGTSVCRSGSTSGWHCGTIQAKNQSVSYPEGPVNGLTRTDVCAEPGDSGGSFIAGDQAQGTTSGGFGSCASAGMTYFQPINAALQAQGVQLLTR